LLLLKGSIVAICGRPIEAIVRLEDGGNWPNPEAQGTPSPRFIWASAIRKRELPHPTLTGSWLNQKADIQGLKSPACAAFRAGLVE
jgi:hypothetical protein